MHSLTHVTRRINVDCFFQQRDGYRHKSIELLEYLQLSSSPTEAVHLVLVMRLMNTPASLRLFDHALSTINE